MKIIAWALALVLGVLTLACGPKDGAPDGRSQPRDGAGPHGDGPRGPAGDPIVHLEAFIEDKCSPYELHVHIDGGIGNIPTDPIPVAAGRWEHDVVYRSGGKFHVVLGVFAKKGCTGGVNYCKISDGPLKGSGAQPLPASGVVVCEYTTSR